jgi:uncharacterized BrkB/YihY/UPF0761 family membrane protein
MPSSVSDGVTSPAAGLARRTTRYSPLARSGWVFGPLAGIAVGVPILGIGGRIAMRVIAHATDVAPGFSLGGTLTVVLMGAVSGAAGGLIYAVLHRVLPNRDGWRALIFGVVLVLLTLHGLSPATPLSLSLFLPLTLLYGALMSYVYPRRVRSSLPRSNATSSDE